MSETILSRCEAQGLRLTEQRRTIAQVLEDADDHSRKYPHRSFDDCHVADVERIERPGKHCEWGMWLGHG